MTIHIKVYFIVAQLIDVSWEDDEHDVDIKAWTAIRLEALRDKRNTETKSRFEMAFSSNRHITLGVDENVFCDSMEPEEYIQAIGGEPVLNRWHMLYTVWGNPAGG